MAMVTSGKTWGLDPGNIPVGKMREVLLGLQKAILPSAPELGEH